MNGWNQRSIIGIKLIFIVLAIGFIYMIYENYIEAPAEKLFVGEKQAILEGYYPYNI